MRERPPGPARDAPDLAPPRLPALADRRRGDRAAAAAGVGGRHLRRRHVRRHRAVHDPADANRLRLADGAGVPRDQRTHLRPPRRPRSRRLVLQPRRDQPARRRGRAPRLRAAVLRRRHHAGRGRRRRRLPLAARGTTAAFHARYQPAGEVAPAAPGTLEFFLAERYLLYARSGAAACAPRASTTRRTRCSSRRPPRSPRRSRASAGCRRAHAQARRRSSTTPARSTSTSSRLDNPAPGPISQGPSNFAGVTQW